MNNAFKLGMDAYHKGDECDTNPYDDYDVNYDVWDDGYQHAMFMDNPNHTEN